MFEEFQGFKVSGFQIKTLDQSTFFPVIFVIICAEFVEFVVKIRNHFTLSGLLLINAPHPE